MKECAKYAFIGIFAGFVNGLFGAGAGMIIVPLLTSWAKIDYRKALPTSVAIVLPICVTSIIVFLLQEKFDFILALPYLLGGLLGGFISGRIYKKIPLVWMRRMFALFIIYGGVKNLL